MPEFVPIDSSNGSSQDNIDYLVLEKSLSDNPYIYRGSGIFSKP
jgi:hypothetical protein